MFGLLYIIIIYALVFGLCLLFKFLIKKFTKKEEVKEPSSSKIYYITNNAKPKRKKKTKAPEIAIKGAIVDKDEIN